MPEIKFPAAEINNVFLKKGLPHHVSRSFTFVQDDAYRQPSFRAGTKCFVGNLVNATVTRSDKSVTLMTPYRLPHHGNRSFTSVQDDD